MGLDKIRVPGEHMLFLKGIMGPIEAILTIPPILHTGSYLALLGHPHSLQGGTMHNKVVTTLARAFQETGIPSLRFNFRGVGKSVGVYDAGLGESEDMLLLLEGWKQQYPQSRFLIAGFSFGSYVAYRAAAQTKLVDLLLTIAPAVHHYDYKVFNEVPPNWYIIQGEEDEVVPAEKVFNFAASFKPPLPVIPFAETSHFFHGKLLPLKAEVIKIITQILG